MITLDDHLYFVDVALDRMASIVTELGDELANNHVDAAGVSSPFAILTHCLGVTEFWAGHLIAGRPSDRDRDAELVARRCATRPTRKTRTCPSDARKALRCCTSTESSRSTSVRSRATATS